MMHPRRSLLLLIAATLLIAAEGHACSCAGPIEPERAFADASIVFEGKVVSVSDNYTLLRRAADAVSEKLGHPPKYEDYEGNYGFTVTFDVTRMWRGGGQRRIRIITGRGGGDCGYRFEQGKTYLVYGHCDAAGTCGTSICSRTGRIADRASDLRYLGSLPQIPLRKR